MVAIRKVLIANRGEIAVRVIRAARGLGIRTVAVYSDADADACFVADADEAVRLPGVLPAATYLDAAAIIAAARRTDADAVHPGYGFLSENARFAEACASAGLTFVGPPPAAIAQMGDKLRAKEMMAAAGVPVLPGTTVGDSSVATLERELERIGYPSIVKASAGGGGRGMRIVNSPDEIETAIASARREAGAAFGDDTVFVERYVSPARHIEVQVIADNYGSVASLFERECSIQRRHQKIVEESPSAVVDADTRAALCTAAEAAARAVGYRGVGTVEFVMAADRTFAFLEMNTRLQVEHPVTEAITGLDLVQWQLRIAGGDPLDDTVLNASIDGHAIEVRLCAEDPAAGFLPSAGLLHTFEIGGPGLRVDTGVGANSLVPPYYDSMLAKVIAWSRTRAEAAALLADGLQRARIHGVATNRDLLVRVLRSAEFLDGDTTTDFVERVAGLLDPLTPPAAHETHAVAAAIVHLVGEQRGHGKHGDRSARWPAGWRNNRSQPEWVEFSLDDSTLTVGVTLAASPPVVEVDGRPVDVQLHNAAASLTAALPVGSDAVLVDASIDGVRRRYCVAMRADTIAVDSPLGSSTFRLVDRLPVPQQEGQAGSQVAPMPGTVVKVLVEVGQTVEAGDPLVVLEAMKMEHTLTSPHAGIVEAVHVNVGDQVERGERLVSVEPHP
ncbi:MAG: propionyl-CoA carboxylase alpha chain [Acidimicrobiaceae bacterium]|nr:propionyl-CoA carboxylase alpha chain [Acidimicrobiaceae bacterium]